MRTVNGGGSFPDILAAEIYDAFMARWEG